MEVLLYVWIAAFAYEEIGEFRDAGTLFYAADFWSLWDIGIIGVGLAFLITSEYFQFYAVLCQIAFQYRAPASFVFLLSALNLSGAATIRKADIFPFELGHTPEMGSRAWEK